MRQVTLRFGCLIGLAVWALGMATATGIAAEEKAQSEAPAPAPRAAPAPWPARVAATYKISFNGFDIGEFRFNSSVQGQSYQLTGNAELSALLGAFTWSGRTNSAGAVAGESPQPAGYTFDFRSNQRGGSIKMSFADGSVANVSSVPPAPALPGSVPLRPEHLRDVLDPLSAVMAISRGRTANPCGRRLAVFDGRQRFDLLLSFRRQQRIAEQRPSGQPGVVFVCRVRYIPIAGHRSNDETRQMAAEGGIEIALRPVPTANLMVPYQITIPTVAGTAVLTSQRIDIVTQSQRQIALVH